MKKQSVSITRKEKLIELVEINSKMTREQALRNLLESLRKQGFKFTDNK